MSQTKIHLRSLRLYVNAGLDFPACKAGEKLLDMDAARWTTTTKREDVTCKKCINTVAKNGDDNF